MSVYHQDGLHSIHDHSFMSDARFQRAYARGVAAAGMDYAWHWRVHVGLWAARTAAKIDGDFVECGVNRGFLASAIMTDLDWNATQRVFYLLDTFKGLDERYVTPEERAGATWARAREELERGFYTLDVEEVRANFAEWRRVEIIVGSVPETLERVTSSRIAFLHIDMNCSPPEVAALRTLWARLAPGAPVLLDDYAYHGYGTQKMAMDALAAELGVPILSLPTGQGLIMKPPSP
jgi:hypothetical protein